jgi:hypothetical protein
LKTIRKSLMILSVAAVLSAVSVGGAYAYQYDGSDPHSTGCDSNASTIFNLTTSGSTGQPMHLELRFSYTCSTAWARVTCESEGYACTHYSIKIHRNNDGAEQQVNVPWWGGTPDGNSLYTNQLYDAGSLNSKACIVDYTQNSNWVCTSSY